MSPKTKINRNGEVEVVFCVRLPRDLYEELKEDSKTNQRTMKKELVERLKKKSEFFEERKISEPISLSVEETEEETNYSTIGDNPKEYTCPVCGEKRGPDEHLCVNARPDGVWWCENCGASGTKEDLKR